MTDFHEHQLQMMGCKLAAFKNGELSPSALIIDLEGLFSALDLDDEDWRKAFWEAWGELEISYALGLDRPLEPMDEVSVKLVWEAVADLDSLVAAKLPQG